MSLTISTKIVLSADVAGITLLTWTPTPTLALDISNNTDNHYGYFYSPVVIGTFVIGTFFLGNLLRD